METATAFDVRPYRQRFPLELAVAFSRDLLDGSRRMDAVGGDAVSVGLGPSRVLWIRHPDLVRALLIENNADVTKARGMRLLQLLVGEGLLSSEVPKHTRQRRLVLPAFHHARLRGYGDVMTRLSAETAGLWREGETVNVGAAMGSLALAIAGETLFGATLEADSARIADALQVGMEAFDKAQFPYADRLMWLPLPNTLRARRAVATVDEVVYRLIRQRRAETARASGDGAPPIDGGAARGDLLQMLLDAQDEDTGAGMTDEEVRDEAVTLLMAGHETTANALTWTWMLLAQHPDAEARLHAEVDALGRDPGFDDLRALPYTRQVFAESLRLLPPAWIFSREAAHDFDLAGEVPVARGTMILIAPYFLHRDARFWPAPETFDPDRFAPEAKSSRHKFAY
ncbi:MAG: cytochrome P450, partial [Bacteroidota bacterium]